MLATHISLHPAWVDSQCPNLGQTYSEDRDQDQDQDQDQVRRIHATCKGARSRLRDFVTALRPALEDRYG